MKLILSFDEQTAASTLQQAMAAAGANSIININSAHAVNLAVLLQLANAAGDHKRLNASFNGAQLAGNGLSQFIAASGANTHCSVSAAQSTALPVLLDAINLAGDVKVLNADFNGAQLVSDNLQQSVTSARLNTSIGVNSAQASDVGALLRAFNIAGDFKKLTASFNGAQLVGNNLQQVLAVAGTKARINLNTAHSVAIGVLLQVLGLAGNSKQLNVQFNGTQLVADNLQQAVAAAGLSTGISVNTAQAAGIGTLMQVLGLVGDVKSLGMDFNGAQLQSDNLQRVLAAAGTKTSIGLSAAHAVGIDMLIHILDVAGNSKSLSVDFNGAQLVADNLQRAVRSSGANVNVNLSSAQSVPVSMLLDVLHIAG